MNRNGVVFHAGFSTYLLIAVILVIVLYFVAPFVFGGIVDALSQLAKAITGG